MFLSVCREIILIITTYIHSCTHPAYIHGTCRYVIRGTYNKIIYAKQECTMSHLPATVRRLIPRQTHRSHIPAYATTQEADLRPEMWTHTSHIPACPTAQETDLRPEVWTYTSHTPACPSAQRGRYQARNVDTYITSLPAQPHKRQISGQKCGHTHITHPCLPDHMPNSMSSCPDWQKLVILLLDEMYIKEDLVYNKHPGKLISFAKPILCSNYSRHNFLTSLMRGSDHKQLMVHNQS